MTDTDRAVVSSVEFQLLGSLEVVTGDKPHQIKSARQRILLSMLLLHANQLVPTGVLIDAVWNETPPATARTQIHACISSLRRYLARIGAASEITTSPVGYMLVMRDRLDIETFEELVSRGRAADEAEDAIAELRAALDLWRGPAVAGIERTVVQAMATRLNENRIVVLEETIDLALSLGRHRDLIGELGELVRLYPLREKLRAQHMLCLYRLARQADALESFREARQIFMDELGLDPGAELRELERAILANDHRLDLEQGNEGAPPRARPAHPAIPCQTPAAIADFTGRRDLMQTLIELLSAPPEPDGNRYVPLVVLTGKGGVGKTALALQVAHAVRQNFPDGQLFAQLTEADGQPIRAPVLLEQFLRALGLPSNAMPSNLAERAAAYRTALGDRRVLIVLDNVESAGQVLPLIPGSADCAVIVTSRGPLSDLQGAHHFEVQDLDEQTSIKLLTKVIGPERVHSEEAAALAIVRLCGGVPLALRILAAKLAQRPHWRLEKMVRRLTDDERRLDELTLGGVGIRTTLTLSYSGLSDTARRLFLRLSLLGMADFAFWVCAPLLDLDIDAAADLLDTLIEARLVEVWVPEDGTPRFHLHDLVRIYALERLTAEESTTERVLALQRLLRCWLGLAIEAHRRSYGGDFAVLHSSTSPWTMPAELVDELLNNPITWFRAERAGLVSAIIQAGQAGLDELCWDLALTSVTLFESDHHIEDWYKTHEVALAVVRRAKNLRGEAALLCSLGNLSMRQSPSRGAEYLESALAIFEKIDDTHGRALALSFLGYADRQCAQYGRGLVRYLAALEGFRAVGDRASESDALTSIAQIHMVCGRPELAEGFLSQALVICESLNSPRIAAQTNYRLGEFLLSRGELEAANRTFRSVLDLVRDQHDLVGEAYALIGLGQVHARQRLHDLAETELLSALTLSRQVGDNLIHTRVLLALADAFMASGKPELAVPLVNEATVVIGEIGPSTIRREHVLDLRSRLDQQIGLAPKPADSALGPAPARRPAALAPPWRNLALRTAPSARQSGQRSVHPHGGPPAAATTACATPVAEGVTALEVMTHPMMATAQASPTLGMARASAFLVIVPRFRVRRVIRFLLGADFGAPARGERPQFASI
jgi:DNA-binding SARP family transcriptional activator